MKNIENLEVRTRFAPSPTGDLHIGGARTAIFSWLTAKHFKGKFLLRIEDTDKQREKEGATQKIIEGLQWLGIDWDEPIIYQSKRLEIYKKYLKILQEKKQVYYCNCTFERLERIRQQQLDQGKKPKYDGHCRELSVKPESQSKNVIRFKTPIEGTTFFKDLVRGDVRVENSELDDLVIWRSLEGPTYNFCVVIDDWMSRITHVVRGEDHVNNTHRQTHIAEALGAPKLIYAHVPMILDENGQKLSKRRQASSLLEYRDAGIIPEAMINYLAKLGWGYKNQELFSCAELIELFDLSKVKPSPAAIDSKKLDWLNKKYLHSFMDETILLQQVKQLFEDRLKQNNHNVEEFEKYFLNQFKEVFLLYRSRVRSLEELSQCLMSFFYPNNPNEEDWTKFKKDLKIVMALKNFCANLDQLQQWDRNLITQNIGLFLEEVQDNQTARSTLRYILLAQVSTPPIDAVLFALGKKESVQRLLKFLKN